MNIAIIGSGNIGGTLARKLVKAGHQVRIANSRGVDGVRSFAHEIGATACDIHTVAENTDVLILSVPFGVIPQIPKHVFANLPANTIVVDTGNYYPVVRDEPIEAIDHGQVESIWVSEKIDRPVIKAFNTLLANSLANLGKAEGDPERIALFVSGDDARHKQAIMGLVDQCGFDALDGGKLSDSWKQQPGSAGYCCDYTAQQLQQVRANSTQTPDSVRTNNLHLMKNFAEIANNDFSAENIIKINRIRNR